MGIVYEAKDPLIGRTIAVKTIRVRATSRPDEAKFLQQQLFKEATAAGQLSHPNIVTIHDVGMEGEMAFIAMEKVEGASLHDSIAPGDRLEPGRAIGILHQCAQALDYAHQKGIVHRDVKPANIMLQEGGHVKIADFGIAKNTLSPKTTGFAVAMGTPSYMSPEQIRIEPLNGRSDQFSLAVVAYELLTGAKAFEGDSVEELFPAIRDGPRPSAHEACPQLPVAADAVLQRALAKSPGDRYPTCAEFVSALETGCRSEVAKPKRRRQGRSRTVLPYVSAAASAGLIALAVLAGGAAYWRFAHSTAKQPVPVPSPAKLIAQAPPPSVLLFSADPGSPGSEKRSALHWDVHNANEVFIDPSVGSVPPSGSAEVAPSTATTYQLTASGPGGRVTASASVEVLDRSRPSATSAPPRILLFQARPPVLRKGGKFELKWLVEGMSDLSIDGIGEVTGDHVDMEASATTTYTLTARSKSGTVTREATVTVENPPEVDARKAGAQPGASDAAQLFNQAVALRNSGEGGQAVPLFRQAAELGNVHAMLELGTSLRGAGDLKGAFSWFRKAADAGNVSAMVFAGAMYAQGSGAPKDEVQAAQWFRRAADLGNSVAMDGLGQMYASGRGVGNDLPEAVRWYRRAAERGNNAGMLHAASAYENGVGVARDLNEAILFYRMAAAMGDTAAITRLRIIEAGAKLPDQKGQPRPVSAPVLSVGRIPGTINIPGNQRWTDTGLTLNVGDSVKILATGSIVVNENGRAARMSPDGLTSGDCVVNPVTYGRDSAFPAPHAPCWSLIGRIGIKGGIFKVGARTVILAPSHGDLMLGVNDSDVAGNSGAWAVSATVTKGSGTPPKPGVDQLTLTSIDPSAISEKGTHKYTVQGIGLTKETTITLSVPSPAFAGSKSRLQDSRPADVSAGGTRITVYIYIGAQPGKSSIRVAARSASTATAFLDVPIKR